MIKYKQNLLFHTSIIFFRNTNILFSLILLELGIGWTPAVADDPTELNFIQDMERSSTDDQSYWIGGLAYETLESGGYSQGKGKIKLTYILLLNQDLESHTKHKSGIVFILCGGTNNKLSWNYPGITLVSLASWYFHF